MVPQRARRRRPPLIILSRQRAARLFTTSRRARRYTKKTVFLHSRFWLSHDHFEIRRHQSIRDSLRIFRRVTPSHRARFLKRIYHDAVRRPDPRAREGHSLDAEAV